MAYLTSLNSSYPLFLKTFHQFGRLATAVDTLVDNPEISRIHAVIEWIDDKWYLRDLSKNGVWVNNKAIQPNKLYQLAVNDSICFANKKNITFIVTNLDEPKDVLVPFVSDKELNSLESPPILLEHYHFLPSEDSPEVIIFYDVVEKCWYCETINDSTPTKLYDGELLEFSDSMWKLIKGADAADKETLVTNDNVDNDLCYIFNISQDEELTELTLKNSRADIDCETRSHHYLTALLARYKGQDKQDQLPEHLQGWRTIEQLTKDIGLSENHVNIQIHRARKQLADKLQSEGIFGPLLIERKRGRVRFAASDFKVFKGQELEVDSMLV
ncbi:FHA domain-containing protein [Photobacterium makurazakiensis]|uniref:FHA domain-containing protein n=1 Tax=Photobacterium makurazakiensis TaxID=2910234 RepID=UPI003D0ADFAA